MALCLQVELSEDRVDAWRWQAERTAMQVNAEREAIVEKLEEAGAAMWRHNVCDSWLEGAHESIRDAVKTVNGQMMTNLGNAVQHGDCVLCGIAA